MDNAEALQNIVLTIFLIKTIFDMIPLFFIFKKAGIEGYKAFIPIYNTYVLFKICWDSKIFYAYIILRIISLISTTSLTFGLISSQSYFAYLAIKIILMNKLSKSFGQNAAFTVGLVLVPFVFELILGLDKSRYQNIQKPIKTFYDK